MIKIIKAKPLAYLLVGVSLSYSGFWAGGLVASEANTSVMLKEQSVPMNNPQWANWILTQVDELPALQATKLETLVAQEQRTAAAQPRYNPELNLSYTEKGDRDLEVVFSQTIDWYDKRYAHLKLGEVNFDLSVLKLRIERDKRLADALYAYVDYVQEWELLGVARQQEKLLEQLANELQRRQQLGDVGNIDAELAYLSLSQNLQKINLGEIRYRKACLGLGEHLNSEQLKFRAESRSWINFLTEEMLTQSLASGFTQQLLSKRIEQSRAQADLTKLQAKNNPTLGFGAGREGSENTFTLEVSIPLNTRNDYSAEYRASLNQVMQAKLQLQEQHRVLAKQIRMAWQNYRELVKRLKQWQNLTTKRMSGSKKILNRLWQSGEMTTSDYLFALQQRSDSLVASIELRTEMQRAWIDWLLLTNRVEKWLNQLSHQADIDFKK